MDTFEELFGCKRLRNLAISDRKIQESNSEYTQQSQKLLILGPPKSGRTSLLFEVALQHAESGLSVIFVLPRRTSILPLLFSHREQPSVNVLNRIQIVYLDSKIEFLEFMASIHMKYKEPKSLLIVDDVDYYFKQDGKYNEMAAESKIFAFLFDAVAFLDKLWISKPLLPAVTLQCSIICSTTILGDNKLPQKVTYHHLFSNFLWIEETKNLNMHKVYQKEEKGKDFLAAQFCYKIQDKRIEICGV